MEGDRVVLDQLEGVPHPAQSHPLAGHEQAVAQLLQQGNSGRLHHAILLSGPKGVGKATLAFRFAAALLRSRAEGELRDIFPVEDPVQAKITAGAHPNLLHLARPWDAKAKRFKTKLTVDEIRLTNQFFGTSRGEKGWRVAIIDCVDDMNTNAANALLKVLEEPPEETVFLCIAHSLARVMPTIRSRCQHLPLKPLGGESLLAAMNTIGMEDENNSADRDDLLRLAGGSVRKAITLIREGGLELHRDFQRICSQLSRTAWPEIHAIAEKICARGSEDRYFLFLDFVNQYMEARATGKGSADEPISALARWAEVWEKTQNSVRAAESYNLDRKQVILNLFDEMGEAARF